MSKYPAHKFEVGEFPETGSRPALKFVKFESDRWAAMAVQQNPNKSSKWAALARRGTKVVWVWTRPKGGGVQRWYCYVADGDAVVRVHPDQTPVVVGRWR